MEETQSPGAALAAMRPRVEVPCEVCGKLVERIHRKTDAHHYCSPEHRYQAWIAANDGKRPATKKPRGPRSDSPTPSAR